MSSIELCKPSKCSNWVWKHFSKYSNNHKKSHIAVCDICFSIEKQAIGIQETNREAYLQQLEVAILKCEIIYGKCQAPSKLEQHINAKHKAIANAKRANDAEIKAKQTKLPFATTEDCHTTFLDKYVKWVCCTFQPISTCEQDTFTEMIQFLSKRNITLTRSAAKERILQQAFDKKEEVKKLTKGQHVAITSDHWTSVANENYCAVTGHFIDCYWDLYAITLKCEKREGTSRAEDIADEIRGSLDDFALRFGGPNSQIVAVVSDTAPNMISAGRLLQNQNGIPWNGCVDHILELTTGLAFSDQHIPGGLNVMVSARRLVGHFCSSSQATEQLLAVQPVDSKLKVIQDVATRWWSTYSMCDRLLRLRHYFNILVDNAVLDANLNLSNEQWDIILRITKALKPFMIVQQFLEGEYYITICFVPYLISTIRSTIKRTIEDPNEHLSVVHLAEQMLQNFNSHWGSGEAGTVFTEHQVLGHRQRPKGLPLNTMFAAALDPRTKFLNGIPAEDRNMIWGALHQKMIQQYGQQHDAHAPQPNNENVEVNLPQDAVLPQRYEIFADLAEPDDFLPNNNGTNANAIEIISNELNAYRATSALPMQVMVDNKNVWNNSLDWWRLNAARFPILSKLARMYLCIPATSAPSERVFSAAGLTIANNRARLHGDLAAAQVFLHDIYPAIQLFQTRKRRREQRDQVEEIH
jgi:hypothetical protein